MSVTSLDQDQNVLPEWKMLFVDYGGPGARNDEKPLICPAMAVGGVSPTVARRNDHFGGLRILVARHDSEAFTKTH